MVQTKKSLEDASQETQEPDDPGASGESLSNHKGKPPQDAAEPDIGPRFLIG